MVIGKTLCAACAQRCFLCATRETRSYVTLRSYESRAGCSDCADCTNKAEFAGCALDFLSDRRMLTSTTAHTGVLPAQEERESDFERTYRVEPT